MVTTDRQPTISNVAPIDPNVATRVKRAAELIADADALIVAAGAGMGVASGLPDFCGTHGFGVRTQRSTLATL